MRRFLIFLFILAVVLPGMVIGNTSGAFLDMPKSAKEVSLAGSLVAVNQEIDAVTYNPAGLSKFDGFGFSLLYDRLLFGNTYAKAVIVHPAGFGMLGVSFTYLGIPFKESFNFGAVGSSQSLSDIDLSLAFQRDITEGLSVGISAKFISIDLGGAKASTAGADAGILYQINPKASSGRLNIGLGVRDLGLGLKFDNENEKLPMNIMGGIMYQPVRLLSLYGEVDKPQDLDIEYGGGLELNIKDIVKPRVGYRGGNGRNGLSAGLGIGMEAGSTKLALDYGIEMGAEMSHIVEVKMSRPAIFEFKVTKQIPWNGQEKINIAVSEFEAKTTDVKDVLGTVTEWLRSDLGQSQAFRVLARESMAKILKEQELQMSGLTTTEDAVAVGEILNVKYIILGSLSKVGSEYYVNAKVVDVGSSEVVTTVEEAAGSKATLRIAVKKLAMKIDPAYNK